MPEVEEDQQNQILPPGTFFTCSSDDTIRAWNLSAPQNIYSAELMKILYMDPELSFVCDSGFASLDKSDVTYDGQNGVRCLRVSPDGNHLASGDRSGNVR
ncbi:WDR62 [Cordylochernes scorpioides]|uniref:WDR62 n=1 Tax=Cordylochernes scorpioides TaxID=51811 RepID=A0ABY6LP18_9ARAC|nr:WDR62 [Cordylochernes scorpioides]